MKVCNSSFRFGSIHPTGLLRSKPLENTLNGEITLELGVDESTGVAFLIQPTDVKCLKPDKGWFKTIEPESHLDLCSDKISELIRNPKKILCFSYKDICLHEKHVVNQKLLRSECDVLTGKEESILGENPEEIETHLLNLDKILEHQLTSSYDIVIFRHFLEHYRHPEKILQKLESFVSDRGVLIIEVPSSSQFLSSADPLMMWEQHVCYFTPNTLSAYLNANTNMDSYIQSYNYPLEDSIVAYLTRRRSNKNVKPNQHRASLISEISDKLRGMLLSLQSDSKLIGKKFNSIKARHGKIYLYGAGHNADRFIQLHKVSSFIDQVIDSSTDKVGLYLSDIKHPIVKFIPETTRLDLVLIATHPRSFEKVRSKLMAEGCQAQIRSIFRGSKDFVVTIQS